MPLRQGWGSWTGESILEECPENHLNFIESYVILECVKRKIGLGWLNPAKVEIWVSREQETHRPEPVINE